MNTPIDQNIFDFAASGLAALGTTKTIQTANTRSLRGGCEADSGVTINFQKMNGDKMALLDISINGTKPPKPISYTARVAINDDIATPERLARSEPTINEDGVRQFKDELLVRLADKGQLDPCKKLIHVNKNIFLVRL
jgi:hypothetical protein